MMIAFWALIFQLATIVLQYAILKQEPSILKVLGSIIASFIPVVQWGILGYYVYKTLTLIYKEVKSR